ncbi:RNA polymerase II transcription factor B subunit 4 [Gaertneriomyces sp. JEL0708]|nr:RNA polymerase II transcription factor B subunit 4 [Gaertneriomyces sp. JEL0708]
MSGADEDINFLAVIVDTNPLAWSQAAGDPQNPIEFTQVLEHLLIFINAHLALRSDNDIAIIASHNEKSQFLYPPSPSDVAPPAADRPLQAQKPANAYKQFYDADVGMTNTLRSLVSKSCDQSNRSMIAGAISLALAYINKLRQARELAQISLHARIVIFSISADASAQYIPIMNCIFAAQKLGIKIDVCRFTGKTYGRKSVFLPQASYITGGIYLEIPEPKKSLLQYLLTAFLPEESMRKMLRLPGRDQVDFRAACFCHKTVVDVGFVCSVCLSIFCSVSDECPTCRTRFIAKKTSE